MVVPLYSKTKVQCITLRPSVPLKLREICFIFIHSEYSVLLPSELNPLPANVENMVGSEYC